MAIRIGRMQETGVPSPGPVSLLSQRVKPTFAHYRNGIVLLYNGFTFSRSHRLNWYCSRRMSTGCKMRLKLTPDENFVERLVYNHNHPPEKLDVSADGILTKLQHRVRRKKVDAALLYQAINQFSQSSAASQTLSGPPPPAAGPVPSSSGPLPSPSSPPKTPTTDSQPMCIAVLKNESDSP